MCKYRLAERRQQRSRTRLRLCEFAGQGGEVGAAAFNRYGDSLAGHTHTRTSGTAVSGPPVD